MAPPKSWILNSTHIHGSAGGAAVHGINSGDITAFGTPTSVDTRCEVAVRVQAIRPDSRQFRAASFLERKTALLPKPLAG
jgi:hypothetical protein